ncbi:rhodopsin-like [Physella acuta]|uniref:rhodopsin-like n=1 Tax=Physella acuta TaxID=109671 RepID=UPI0027DAF1FD|nr:rhodopsin-like [Physella acuta]
MNSTDENNLYYVTSGPVKIISDEALALISVVLKSALYEFCSVVGITTNCLNLVVFWKIGFKDTVNVSLFAIAVSDACSLISLFWMSVCYNPLFANSDIIIDSRGVQYLTGGWPKFYFTRVSAMITAYVTFERCLCTAMPLKVKAILTPKRVLVIVSAIYIGLALSISPIYLATTLDWKFYPGRNKTLVGLIFSANKETINSISIGLNVVLCNGSFIFVTVNTLILVCNINKSMQFKESFAKVTGKKISKETKASKMVILTAGVFIVCLFPSSLVTLGMVIFPSFNAGEAQGNLFFTLASVIHISEAINASLNILVYVHMSSKFKQTFTETFACFRHLVMRKSSAKVYKKELTVSVSTVSVQNNK